MQASRHIIGLNWIGFYSYGYDFTTIVLVTPILNGNLDAHSNPISIPSQIINQEKSMALDI